MAADTATTRITVRKTLLDAIDRKVAAGEFTDRDQVIALALTGFLERRARYDALIQEGLDDIAAGNVHAATPEFFERLRSEAKERARGRRSRGERLTPDPDVFGPFDDR